MKFSEGTDTILKVFSDLWRNLELEAVYDDVGGEPAFAEDASWARVRLQHTGGGQNSLSGADSTRVWIRNGILTIQVFAPRGDGGLRCQELSQLVVDTYQAAKTAVIFRNVRMVEVPDTKGLWKQSNVIAEFEYTDVR